MRSTIARVCLFGFGILMMVCSMTGHAMASTVPVPEIDGSTLSAGLAAATAAVLIVRARRRSK